MKCCCRWCWWCSVSNFMCNPQNYWSGLYILFWEFTTEVVWRIQFVFISVQHYPYFTRHIDEFYNFPKKFIMQKIYIIWNRSDYDPQYFGYVAICFVFSKIQQNVFYISSVHVCSVIKHEQSWLHLESVLCLCIPKRIAIEVHRNLQLHMQLQDNYISIYWTFWLFEIWLSIFFKYYLL